MADDTDSDDSKQVQNITMNDLPADATDWKKFRDDRRHMAWVALWAMIAATLIMFFAPIPLDKLVKLADMIEWFYFTMTSIVGAYIGFKTWTQITKKD